MAMVSLICLYKCWYTVWLFQPKVVEFYTFFHGSAGILILEIVVRSQRHPRKQFLECFKLWATSAYFDTFCYSFLLRNTTEVIFKTPMDSKINKESYNLPQIALNEWKEVDTRANNNYKLEHPAAFQTFKKKRKGQNAGAFGVTSVTTIIMPIFPLCCKPETQ